MDRQKDRRIMERDRDRERERKRVMKELGHCNRTHIYKPADRPTD